MVLDRKINNAMEVNEAKDYYGIFFLFQLIVRSSLYQLLFKKKENPRCVKQFVGKFF